MNAHPWTHSWDDCEMLLFIGKDDAGQEKIFARVSKMIRTDAGPRKEILYEREICLLNPEIIRGLDRDAWEAKQLRWFVDTHQELVDREKAYLKEWEKRSI